MLQRKQSIYLFISSLIFAVFALNLNHLFDFKHLNFKSINFDFGNLFSITFIISACISFVTILLFKNRKTQINMGKINIIWNIILIGFLIYCLQSLPGDILSKKGILISIPLLSIVLVLIANKLIKKDDNLVKSVNRFR